jgi:hypothetical protein
VNEAQREAFLGMLQVAVMAEMSMVTDASMELFHADRAYHLACESRADALSKRRNEIRDRVHDGIELTPDERAEITRLSEEVTALHEQAAAIPSMWIYHYGDDLLYGGNHGAKTFAALAVAIAHMAQEPGGITFAGLHWCAGSGHRGTGDRYPCDAELQRERDQAVV